MPKIKLVMEYDGSHYHGFQKQRNAHTIQAELEQAIYHISRESVTVIAAGRTDAGVHALGQVASFHTGMEFPADRWRPALNSVLPGDVRILKSELVSASFHPQYDSLYKSYQYLIYRKKERAVFYRQYALLCDQALEIEVMQEACHQIIGRHDFRCFCASGSGAKTWERTIYCCRLEEEGDWLKLHITADGFLYNMVRIIVGTLLEIGRGRMKPGQITNMIASCERSQAGPTAPPQGLYLCSVNYPSSAE
ncbi:MAG TPA: tRNA pseudouridine(38-40) synthase TruA [Syntrophomonas sp.]|nr:tRNA pseudouridine(38-40) synthase TruA [Syntrophomonas sp.]HRW13406.1 tRNA pseudouridine(38-40) synthase TruA [Syntrophomonas sp.]